jgi:hypothetical protein
VVEADDRSPRTLVHNDRNPRNIASGTRRRLSALRMTGSGHDGPLNDLAELLACPPQTWPPRIPNGIERHRVAYAAAGGKAASRRVARRPAGVVAELPTAWPSTS